MLETNQTLFIEHIMIANHEYTLAISDKGLAYLGNRQESQSELEKFFPSVSLLENPQKTAPYRKALSDYFNQKKWPFPVPLDLKGTTFQQEVWQGLLEIPFGNKISYSELAKKINRPTAIRAVANAIGRNPVMIAVPCHRVIGKNGHLTGFRGGLALKEQLLSFEKDTENSKGEIR